MSAHKKLHNIASSEDHVGTPNTIIYIDKDGSPSEVTIPVDLDKVLVTKGDDGSGNPNPPEFDNPPNSIPGVLSYQGAWNASTNSPALVSSTGTQGDYYVVSVGGSTVLDGISSWALGEWLAFNGSTWEKIDNSSVVASVNGSTGAVTLDTDDINEGITNEYYTTAKARAAAVINSTSGSETDRAPSVSSVNSKFNSILPATNLNLIPNADLQDANLYTASVTSNFKPNFWYNLNGGLEESFELVKGLDVPSLLDETAMKIDLKAGQQVYMYSGGLGSAYHDLDLGTARLSGGLWIHSTDWTILGSNMNLRAREVGTFSDLKIFSTYKPFGNWRFYYFENELTSGSHTNSYRFFIKFLNSGGSAIDVIVHVCRPVLIESETILPQINKTHYTSTSFDTQITAINDELDTVQNMIQRHGKNVVADPLFENELAGETDPSGWSFVAGGTGAHPGTHVIADDEQTPLGSKSLKLGVDYTSGSDYADIQAYKTVFRETQFIGNTSFSFLYYMKKEDGVSLWPPYLQYYDGGGLLASQFSNEDNSTLDIVDVDVDVTGEWQICRYNMNVPAGAEDFTYVRIGTRFKGTSALIGLGYKYAWITGLTVNFDNNFVQEYFNPNRSEEITELINDSVSGIVTSEVTSALDSRSILSGDKKNFGSRIKRTLTRLFSNESTSDSDPQRLLDNHVRIVHIGDSIVNQGYSSEYVVDGVSGEVDNLDFLGLTDRFKNANFSFVNAGVGGQRAFNFRHYMLSQVVPYDPDLVLVSTWGNDLMNNWTNDVEEYAVYYEQIIKNIRKYTIADIMILSYSLYPSTYETVANSPGTKVLKSIATKYDCEFVDIAKFMYEHGKLEWDINSDGTDLGEWVTQGYYSVGNVHPLEKGKKLMAKAIIQHFPRINEFDQDFFDWNGPVLNIQNREKRIELIDSLEFYDDEITLNDPDDWVKSSYNGIESASTTANNEYVEIDFYGRQVDLIYKKMSDGAQADILIDGVAPSTVCKNTFKYPDAKNNNYYLTQNSGNERNAKISYIFHDWKTTELITITMTGTDNVLSQTFDIEGSVSGVLGSGLSNAVEQRITSGSDYILLTPDMWYGRTNNIYGQDEFYIYIENQQALDLLDVGDRYGQESPIISVASTLDDSYLLRFAMTSSTDYRLDKVSRQDRGSDTIETNVISSIGTGDVSSPFSQNGITILQEEIDKVSGDLINGDTYYYYVNRKYIDSIDTSTAGADEFRRVTLVSGLKRDNHTLRITKNGTDKLNLSALIIKN